ncbi:MULTISPECIES: transcriptional regulator [Cupriavidus]|jgi:DNA-binding transcriptional regulator YdaS (Cro superfamily)|uniref:transcriptional regulator n=1 Tax=Cupriavidus TaxID=106589 RepID=UPI0004933700|nr:YdaS family helix-turn-helix protein [Cupriavidus metallidurans]MDE4918182.1 YdaS family helix-turn-helix protein [Cupriavidus metallidurans]
MQDSPWQKAVRLAHSQEKLGALLGVTQQTISYYVEKGGPIPAKYWRALETSLGLPRQEQRPEDWQEYWPELAASVQ